MPSFIDELKRRHVAKVLASYVMVAWVLIQVIVAIKEPLNLPAWSDTALIVVLVIGFPISAVLAWIYDVTAKGIERTADRTAGADITPSSSRRRDGWTVAIGVSAAVMMLTTSLYVFYSFMERDLDAIAVLTFDNLSDAPDTLYLGDSLREAVIRRLSRIPGLRVKSRAVVYDPNEDIRDIGRALDVDAICLGAVRRVGEDSLAISAEVVDVSDGTVIWAESFTRALSGLLTLEGEISTAIANRLRPGLSADAAEAVGRDPTENPVAYRLYSQGRYFWNTRTPEGFRRAEELYERAIGLDPTYALAYAGLADTYLMLYGWGEMAPEEAAPLIVSHAETARALDATLAEPHATLGYFKVLYERDWEGARANFERAIELNPSYSSAHHWFAFLHLTEGNMSEAISEILLAREYEPVSPVINAEVGYFYFLNREYDKAVLELERALEFDPSNLAALNYLMRSYALLGRNDDVRESLAAWSRLLEGDYLGDAYGSMVLPRVGLEEEAREVYEQFLLLAADRPGLSGLLGALAAVLGDLDAAFGHFEDAVSERSLIFSWLRDPLLDNMRADPRYAELMRSVGLTP